MMKSWKVKVNNRPRGNLQCCKFTIITHINLFRPKKVLYYMKRKQQNKLEKKIEWYNHELMMLKSGK